jgi:phenylalanyl-tRNA synthetase beta chain
MKFTISWLKEHLDTDADAATIADKLTSIGLEVESVTDSSAGLKDFIVGEVISAEKHPNADKLRLCSVNAGDGAPLQIVCGAPNARAGIKVVLARPGTVIPATSEALKIGTIRGVESRGMMCSARELLLGEDHDGIIELGADAVVGGPAAAALNIISDPLIDVSITPNRGDAASVWGVARDLAAAGLGTLKTEKVQPVAGTFPSPKKITLDFTPENKDACPIFAGRLIRGVKNGPAPKWVQERFKAVGMKSISALVDVTNFVAQDRGRPLHVFDADRLSGSLHARMANDHEQVLALDGKTYVLDTETIVIADDSFARGIAGIMGGEDTGCSVETKNVFLESAWFDPVRVARAGRKLGIISDARYRFERGVDPEFVLPLGGIRVPEDEIISILEGLGFVVAKHASLHVTPPSWRRDIDGPADLVEEVVRIHGLAEVPSVALTRHTAVAKPVLTSAQRRARSVRRTLAARGFNECVSFSFIARDQAKLFGGGDEARQLSNPIASDLDAMRPSLLPSLLGAASRNAARGLSELNLFEIGAAFQSGMPGAQTTNAAGLITGTGPRDWSKSGHAADVFDAKGAMLAALEAAMGGPMMAPVTASAPVWFHPGRSGTIALGPKVIAHFGELHPKILAAFDIKTPASAFEIILDAVPEPKAKSKAQFSPSPFQAIERDFAFVVDRSVAAADIIRAAKNAERVLIDTVSLFDVYEGKGVAEGKKSVAIAVRLQPKDKTLTEAEIEAVAQKIVAAALKLGASLRA